MIGVPVAGLGLISLVVGVVLLATSSADSTVKQSNTAQAAPPRGPWHEGDTMGRAAPRPFEVSPLCLSF
jgi:hypothetical protein